MKPIAVDKEYHKIEWRFTMFTRISAITDRIMEETNAKYSGVIKRSANSSTFINNVTAWLPTRAKAIIAIRATIPILIYFPASGSGVPLPFDVLYKLTKLG